MYCGKCGQKLEEDAVFCSKCGTQKTVVTVMERASEVAQEQSESPASNVKEKKAKKGIIALLIGLFVIVFLGIAVAILHFANNSTPSENGIVIEQNRLVSIWGHQFILKDGIVFLEYEWDDDLIVFEPVQRLENVVEIVDVGFFVYALLEDGTVWALGSGADAASFGRDDYYFFPVQVQGLENVVAISAARGIHQFAFSAYALLENGTVWRLGEIRDFPDFQDNRIENRLTPVQVQGLDNVIAIRTTFMSSYAFLEDGTIWAWGDNRHGQLGIGTIGNPTPPTQVPYLENVANVWNGEFSSFALLEDGTIWAWGINMRGELADGTIENRLTPVQIQGLEDVVDMIITRDGNVYALLEDGTMWTWGYDVMEDRLLPAQVQGLENVVKILESYLFRTAFALLEDGTVWVAGGNAPGNSSTPYQLQGLENVSMMVEDLWSPNLYVFLNDESIWELPIQNREFRYDLMTEITMRRVIPPPETVTAVEQLEEMLVGEWYIGSGDSIVFTADREIKFGADWDGYIEYIEYGLYGEWFIDWDMNFILNFHWDTPFIYRFVENLDAMQYDEWNISDNVLFLGSERFERR